MYAMLRLISDKSGVATQLIATRDDLLEFVNHRETSSLSSSWRYELAGKTLEELLDGRLGLTVKDGARSRSSERIRARYSSVPPCDSDQGPSLWYKGTEHTDWREHVYDGR